MFLCTLAELRPLVRSQAGVQRIHFVSDDDLNGWIIDARGRHYDMYIDGGDPYWEKDREVIADATVTPVPEDFYRLRRVAYLSGTQELELDDLDVHEHGLARNAATLSGAGCAVGYRLRANELQLPGATAGQKYKVTYVPRPDEPRDAAGAYQDTVPFDLVDLSGRRWVVLDAAISVRGKQNEDVRELSRRAAEIEREIRSKATRRTTTRLKRVADVASLDVEDPYLGGGIFGRRGRWR